MTRLLSSGSRRARVWAAAGFSVVALGVAGVTIAATSDQEQFCVAEATEEGQPAPSGGPEGACFDSQAELTEFLVNEGVVLPEGYPPPG